MYKDTKLYDTIFEDNKNKNKNMFFMTPLQISCKIILNSENIVKSIINLDDNF